MGFDAQGRLWGIDAPYQSFQRNDLGGGKTLMVINYFTYFSTEK